MIDNQTKSAGDGRATRDMDADRNEYRSFDREMLDQINDLLFAFTREGKLVWWNDRVNRVTGYSDKEIASMHPLDFVPDEERGHMEEKIREVICEGDAVVEAHCETKTGERIPYEFTGSLLETTDGKLVCAAGRDIADRVQRTEELRRREEQFRLLVEGVGNHAIFMLDPEGRVMTWNDGARRIQGYREEEILGRNFSLFYPDEERESGRAEETLEAAAEQGHVDIEGWRIRKDGSRFWARATVTALTDEEGDLRGFSKITQDMTERWKYEQRLHESERKYRRLFENSQEAIAITSTKGEIMDINPAACKLVGYSRDELLQLNVKDLYVNPEYRADLIKEIEETGVIRGRIVRLRRNDEEEIICRISASTIVGRDGSVEGIQTHAHDITEQVRAKKALQTSEKRYRRLFEESRDAVILTTPEGEVLDVNAAAEELFGYSEEEFLAMDASELYARPKERRERIVPQLMRAHSSSILEAEMRHSDGSTFLASAAVTRHRNEEGKPVLVQSLVRDISRRRRLEEQLLEIQEEERRRIGQELHDGIASQLIGVALMGDRVANDVARGNEVDEEDVREITKLIRDSAEQTRLLSQGLNPVRVGNEGLASALNQLIGRTEKQNGIDCTFDAEGEMVELDDQRTAHLYRIVQEAVNNASKHAQASSIQVCLKSGDGSVRITVTDDGVGLPKDACEEEGGLGLHTMRYRADLMGGSFDIGDGEERGTVVTCEVPAGEYRA